MEASSICYLFKNLPLKSWLAMLDRLGSGALVGKTPAQFNSPEWNNFVEALQQFGEEWAGAFSANTSIEMLEAKNVAGTQFEGLIEKMEKAITRMWRGVDMATAAAGAGESGASVQADEADIFETDDPLVLEEALHEQVSKYAIGWKFGDAAPVYARLKFRGPPEQNVKDDLAVDTFLLPLGLLGEESTLARYNRPKPADGETILQPPAATPPQDTDPDPEPEITNAATDGDRLAQKSPVITPEFENVARLRAAAALQQVMQYPAEQVGAFLKILADDPDHAKSLAPAMLEKWQKITGNVMLDPRLADALAEVVGTSYLIGAQPATAQVTNDGPEDEPRDEHGQWADEPDKISPEEADKKLSAGFEVKNAQGRSIKFGARLKNYLDSKPDADDRKPFLNHAAETVRTGTSIPMDDREVYMQTFRGRDGKAKGMVAVSANPQGEVFNIYRADAQRIPSIEAKVKERSAGRAAAQTDLGSSAAAGTAENQKKTST